MESGGCAGWLMKVRTVLLFACMIVVPGLAMFSHLIPADVRAAARCVLWDQWAEPGSAPAGVEPDGPTGSPAAVAGGGAGAAAPGAAGSPAGAADGHAMLETLGAVAIETRPLEGADGVHVASCRVAMDAAGQLQRVFQAAGPSPAEAVSGLIDQVAGWRERLAARAASQPPR